MSKTKIHVLHTGTVNVDRALPYREKSLHPMPYTGWFRPNSRRITIPVSAYLIEHPKGLILVDTGWGEELRTNQRKHLGWLASSIFSGILPPGQSVKEQMQRLGYHDRDLDIVVLTHMHSDHVSGVKQVAGAKRLIVSDLEWKAANKELGYIRSMWEGVPLEQFQMESIPYGPYEKGLDLFHDGSVYLILTPGHSTGMVSLLVKTDEGWVLLASDVGYSKKTFEENILPGVTTSAVEAAKSIQWVNRFIKRDDCRMVIVNHDPEMKPQILT